MTTVKALKFHTLHGTAHADGSTYEVDDHEVSNLMAQGMATPIDPPVAPDPEAESAGDDGRSASVMKGPSWQTSR